MAAVYAGGISAGGADGAGQAGAPAAPAAAGSITEVHEAEAWVDLISQDEPSRHERSKMETQEWHLGAIPVSLPFPVILFPESTPFPILTV